MKPPSDVDFSTREKRRILAGFIISAIVGVLGVWIGVANSIENGEQNAAAAAENRARDEQTSKLLGCFDDLLGANSVRSVEVGKAAERVTTVTLARDRAKARWVATIARALEITDENSDEALAIGVRFSRQTTELLRADRAVIAAQVHQARVRAKYPVPPPPAKSCDIDR